MTIPFDQRPVPTLGLGPTNLLRGASRATLHGRRTWWLSPVTTLHVGWIGCRIGWYLGTCVFAAASLTGRHVGICPAILTRAEARRILDQFTGAKR